MKVELVGWSGGELAFVAEHASAPGQPLDIELDAVGALRVKVNRCRRHVVHRGDEAKDAKGFLVVARPLDLRRDQRELLASVAAPNVPRW